MSKPPNLQVRKYSHNSKQLKGTFGQDGGSCCPPPPGGKTEAMPAVRLLAGARSLPPERRGGWGCCEGSPRGGRGGPTGFGCSRMCEACQLRATEPARGVFVLLQSAREGGGRRTRLGCCLDGSFRRSPSSAAAAAQQAVRGGSARGSRPPGKTAASAPRGSGWRPRQRQAASEGIPLPSPCARLASCGAAAAFSCLALLPTGLENSQGAKGRQEVRGVARPPGESGGEGRGPGLGSVLLRVRQALRRKFAGGGPSCRASGSIAPPWEGAPGPRADFQPCWAHREKEAVSLGIGRVQFPATHVRASAGGRVIPMQA